MLVGDIVTQRIVIEDGAYFKGGIDIRKDNAKDQTSKRESSSASTSTPVTPVTTAASSSMPAEPVSSTRG